MHNQFLFRIPVYKIDNSHVAVLEAGEDWEPTYEILMVLLTAPESLTDPRLKQSCLTLCWNNMVNCRSLKHCHNKCLDSPNKMMQTFL